MKIFIVEDSKLVIERLTRVFSENPGLEVVGAAGGAHKALKGIEATRPDVVILDLRLQGSMGWDVLRTLKSRPVSPVVIMLTNFPSVLHRIKAKQYGADYFLDKSEEFDKLDGILGSLFPGSPPKSELPNAPTMA